VFTSLEQLSFCSIACEGRADVNVGCAPYPGACPNFTSLPLTQEGHKEKTQHGYLRPPDGDSVTRLVHAWDSVLIIVTIVFGSISECVLHMSLPIDGLSPIAP